MNIDYLKDRFEQAKAIDADIVKIDIEEFASLLDCTIHMRMNKTNLDVLKECKNGEEFIKRYNYLGHGCLQDYCNKLGMTQKEVWKRHCLTEPYRGEEGCFKCRAEFWDAEYKEVVNNVEPGRSE